MHTPAPITISRSTVFAALPPEAMRSEHTLATVALIAFAALVLLLTGAFALIDWQWRSSALRAEADVLELRGTKSPVARVRFVDADGVERIADASGPFNGVQAAVGDRITILYQRGSPQYAAHDDPARNWLGTALFAGFGCLPLLPLPFMWRQVRRQRERYARLQQLGLKRPVESVRVERVPWGKFTRWTLVATWRDGIGRPHETLSGPYAYELVAPDPALLHVLSDPHSPERSVIAPETLPTFSNRAWVSRPAHGGTQR